MNFMSIVKEMCFDIGNVKIPYTVTDSSKTKYIKLIMDIKGLRVVKPIRTKMEEVEKVLTTKINWIYKHYSDFQTMKVDEYKREWQSGELVLYRGKSYNIRVLKHMEYSVYVKFSGKRFEVYVSDKLNAEDLKVLIEASFKKWYKKTALESIRERLDYFCKIIGLSYNDLKVKEQKTRWGSCSKKGNLNFNWKLVMAPTWVLDYVVVHEICHLRYLNHSKDYWAMVERYMPNYKKAEEWLKKNGMALRL
jgi:predicted metal-dependent hydrolase